MYFSHCQIISWFDEITLAKPSESTKAKKKKTDDGT